MIYDKVIEIALEQYKKSFNAVNYYMELAKLCDWRIEDYDNCILNEVDPIIIAKLKTIRQNYANEKFNYIAKANENAITMNALKEFIKNRHPEIVF